MRSFKDKSIQNEEFNNINKKCDKEQNNVNINSKEYKIYMEKIKSKYINKYHRLKNKAEDHAIVTRVVIVSVLIILAFAYYYLKK